MHGRLLPEITVARWIYNIAPESAYESERRTAEYFQSLGDSYTIRWGFLYADHAGIRREGDFIIQGPDGHVLVVEAKAGEPRRNAKDGKWNTPKGDDPFDQAECEKRGVLDDLKAQGHILGLDVPWVDCVVALPDVQLAPQAASYEGYSRTCVLAANDLGRFAQWWHERFHHKKLLPTLVEARRLFDAVYAVNSPAGSSGYTLDFADKVIERQTNARYDVLDALVEHDRLIFRGGPGTGKTWLALETAKRWTKEHGRRVLFLCYNLAFEEWLRAVCAKISPDIVVMSYETLGKRVLGRPHPTDPGERKETTIYFDEVLPRELAGVVTAPGHAAEYDALIVDEAQDHNTAPRIDGVDDPGWWGIYFRLLKNGPESPMAIFHDESQRLVLRSGGFDHAVLRDSLWQAVSLRLTHALRYTRQLVRYFATLDCPHTAGLLRDLKNPRTPLPEGPAPEFFPDTPEAREGEVAAGVIKRWVAQELARPCDIIVLYASGSVVPSWVKQGQHHGVRFHDGFAGIPANAVAAVSVNKAKGLERRAVVLVGLPAWQDACADEYKARTFLIGATRAQQLLAVITRPGGPEKKLS